MKIERTINGQTVEIELTNAELCEAFYEQDRNYYIADVKSRFNCDDFDDSAIADIVDDWKESLGYHDLYWDIYWETLHDVATEHGLKELEED